MIPKVIHYCWFGGKPIPQELKNYMSTWSCFCPDYEIKLWNEDNFNIDSHPFVQSAYEARNFAYVSDYVRAFVLNKFGGIYLDTDVELKESLNNFLDNEAFSGFESKGYPFTSAVWGSIANHSFTTRMLGYYDSIGNYSDKLPTNVVIGSKFLIEEFGVDPTLNKKQIGNNKVNSFHIYPSTHFCLDLPKNYSTHHFYGSWLPNKTESAKDAVHQMYIQDEVENSIKDLNKYLIRVIACSISFRSLLYLIKYYLKKKIFKYKNK